MNEWEEKKDSSSNKNHNKSDGCESSEVPKQRPCIDDDINKVDDFFKEPLPRWWIRKMPAKSREKTFLQCVESGYPLAAFLNFAFLRFWCCIFGSVQIFFSSVGQILHSPRNADTQQHGGITVGFCFVGHATRDKWVAKRRSLWSRLTKVMNCYYFFCYILTASPFPPVTTLFGVAILAHNTREEIN